MVDTDTDPAMNIVEMMALSELVESIAVLAGLATAALADDEDGASPSLLSRLLQQSCLPFDEQQKSPPLTLGFAHLTMNWLPAMVLYQPYQRGRSSTPTILAEIRTYGCFVGRIRTSTAIECPKIRSAQAIRETNLAGSAAKGCLGFRIAGAVVGKNDAAICIACGGHIARWSCDSRQLAWGLPIGGLWMVVALALWSPGIEGPLLFHKDYLL